MEMKKIITAKFTCAHDQSLLKMSISRHPICLLKNLVNLTSKKAKKLTFYNLTRKVTSPSITAVLLPVHIYLLFHEKNVGGNGFFY